FCLIEFRFTFKRIIENKSTEQFSGIPYVMTFLNCLLSAWYGLPFITSNNILIATVNGAGAAIELIYVLIFFLYAPNKQKGKILAMLILVILAFAAAAVISVLAFHGKNRQLFCGTAATIFSIVMYASPMSIIRLVIKTKSVEYMPFFLSFAVVVSCSCWFTYAMLGMDPFVGIHYFKRCIGTLSDVFEMEARLSGCIRKWDAIIRMF
uniref:Nodulin MtN3 family protein n=1 Tax=Solanum tuberosum TaxID=4113 RepID=M1B2X6_SOLTU